MNDAEYKIEQDLMHAFAQDIIQTNSPLFKPGYTAEIINISPQYGCFQVEIRYDGTLYWRDWSFSPNFQDDLCSNILSIME